MNRTKRKPGEELYFSSVEVARMTGCSLRQLQWWDDRGLVCPYIVLHSRNYTSEDVLMCCVIRELRGKGIGLNRMRRLKLSGDFLLMDARGKVRWENSAQAVIDRMKAAPMAFVLVDVGELRAVLQGRNRR